MLISDLILLGGGLFLKLVTEIVLFAPILQNLRSIYLFGVVFPFQFRMLLWLRDTRLRFYALYLWHIVCSLIIYIFIYNYLICGGTLYALLYI